MLELQGFQKKYLRGLAHNLKPLVLVGREGVTAAVLLVVDQALLDHELIKVRFNDFKTEKKALCAQIAENSGGDLVGMVGHVAIFYRPHPKVDKRTIKVPEKS
ncbi:MAG: YhbY family RNA-binding protein [Magnetococcales bacterium]|nr:YhbY family RNA-binding protein [Magnetococcales bacterium]